MQWFLSKYSEHCYALLRIVAGFLFLWHGTQKLFGFPGGVPEGFPPFVIYGAGPIEFLGGVLIMTGLFTHWAAFIASGEMAVAYWLVHGRNAPLPIQNSGELAVLYCFLFLYVASRGAGIWSIDSLRK